jgi:penicillin-binding protein 2D
MVRMRPLPAAALALVLLTGASVALPAQETQDPSRIITPPQSSLVLARDGSLIGEIGREWRTSVALSTLPPYLPQAFIAVEDQRFYQHDGVDLIGVAAAVKDNVLGASRGASTITQQLVGNMHPDIIDRSDRSIGRKLREQQAARDMEKRYSKAQILEAYLNQISFGRNWFGVEAAARHYFGKSARDVTLAEAALLAAIPNGPAIYDPINRPERAKQRRDLVLTRMADQQYITAAQAAAAKREPIRVAPNAGMSVAAPYYVDAVRQALEAEGLALGAGGLVVYTTLDPALQRAADSALKAGALAVEQRPGYRHATLEKHPAGSTDYLQGAFVALHPSTGDVLALVGGRNYAQAPFNRATNGLRQPGSTFKPFVYAAAIRDSLPANVLVADTAITVAYDRTVYRPKNADGEYQGLMTMREALARSRNPVAVQLWERLSADSIVSLARRLGVRAPVAPFPSSAIGASVIQPLNLVSAFTAFANAGAPVEPRLVARVTDATGRTLYTRGPAQRTGALDPHAAFIVRDMLRDAVERGTGSAARRGIPASVPVAGKTGTTDDVSDVWFVGMTPDVVAGVWLGFDRPKTIVPGAAGGTLAAPIFAGALAQWYRARGPGAVWAMPEGLVRAELDRETGALATAETPTERRYVEWFLPGTEPAALRLDARRLFGWGAIVF